MEIPRICKMLLLFSRLRISTSLSFPCSLNQQQVIPQKKPIICLVLLMFKNLLPNNRIFCFLYMPREINGQQAFFKPTRDRRTESLSLGDKLQRGEEQAPMLFSIYILSDHCGISMNAEFFAQNPSRYGERTSREFIMLALSALISMPSCK